MRPLPRLIVISDGVSDPEVERETIGLLESGRRFWLHIRDLWASGKPFEQAVGRIVEHLEHLEEGKPASVNSRLETAVRFGIGYHASGRGPWIPAAREQLGTGVPIGASVHSAEEARIAEHAKANYVVFTPVFPTRGRKGHPGLGTEMLQEVTRSVSIPVFALGGIVPERVQACMEAGAYGVGALSGIFDSEDAASAVDRFNRAIEAV